jgi:hypothetical protein
MCSEKNTLPAPSVSLPLNYTLTRFLYPLDEVKLSFIHSLLNQSNIQEAYFWIFEIHYSGFLVFPFLWQVYLDFYKELNSPSLEKYIFKKILAKAEKMQNNEDNTTVKAIAAIVRNLFRIKPSPNVFFLRQYILLKSSHLQHSNLFSKKEKQTFATLYARYNKKYHILLHSIKQGYWDNVCCYLLHFLQTEPIAALLSLFYEKEQLMTFAAHQMDYIETHNPLSYLLALCCQRTTLSLPFTSKKGLFILPTNEHLQIIKETNSPLAFSKYGLPQIYNTLKIKRLYAIDERIGCFQLLQRQNNRQIVQNWEYYAIRAPLWQARLSKYSGKFIYEQKDGNKDLVFPTLVFPTLVFPTEELKEAFYELYGYEFDEQPKDIVDKSHKTIPIITLKEWYDLFFQSSAAANADANANANAAANANANANAAKLNSLGITSLLFPLCEHICIGY